MDMRRCAGFRSCGVLDRPVERRVDDEHGVSPFDSRRPLSGFRADDLLAEQPQGELCRVDASRDQSPHRHALTALDDHRLRASGLDLDPFDARTGADLTSKRFEFRRQRQRHLVHAAPNELVAVGLEDTREQPADLGPGGVVGPVAHERRKRPEQAFRLV
jgi:hypothetical protein